MGASETGSGESLVDNRSVSRGHDRLLDAIKSVAIVRVILWHTWSWAWLSWIPAMPTMFFTNGALLNTSLERRGWVATVRQRARRLLIPYWFYAALCWVAMLSSGWRPRLIDGLTWALPLADPVGSAELPGLSIPLWYIRAYIWFVLLSGVIKWVEKRIGMWAVLLSGAGAVGLWIWSYAGHDVPFAVADAIGYLPFVIAGMVYRNRGRLGGKRVLLACGVFAAVASVVSWRRFGPVDGVVNRSYLLMLLVGSAGIMLAVVARSPILGLVARSSLADRLITQVNTRALTIYLWQGFGLVAADRLIERRLTNRLVVPLLSIVVVAGVVVTAAFLFGPLEDVAAGRVGVRELVPRIRDKFLLPPLRGLRWTLAVSALVVVVGAVGLPVPAGTEAKAPLSGQAVVARAGLVEESLASHGTKSTTVDRTSDGTDDVPTSVPTESPQEVLDGWMSDNAEVLDQLGLTYLDAVLVSPDGTVSTAGWGDIPGPDDPLPWWSMTKAVTATWLMKLVEDGTVSLDDKLARWVPEMPNAKRITLGQLARHSSGIPEDLAMPIFETDPKSEIARYRRSGRLIFEPGEGFSYSRIGYLLLGLALERATSVTWTDAVRQLADSAGVKVSFDEDYFPHDKVTDPDGHGYRGGLWSSGGLVSTPTDGARFLQWIFTTGLERSSVETMTRFSSDPDSWYYGLGLLPLCPCETDGEYLRAHRFGLDSATGSFAVDRSGAVVVLRPSDWFIEDRPVPPFYDLEDRLLDLVSGPS